MNRYKKLLFDTLILGLGTFGSKLLVFLLMPLYTALLSTDQYGTAELITSTANLVIPLACVGITNGVFRFAADRAKEKNEVFSSGLVLLLGGTLVFLALSPLLSLVTYFNEYTLLIALYVVFANLQALCAQFVRATDRVRLFAVQGILNTLLTIGFNLLFLIVFDLGVTGYVLSVIVGNLIMTIFLAIAAKLWRVFSIHHIKVVLVKEMLFYSLPLIPTTVCWLITDLSDRYMVTWFCGSAENGIYSAAYKIPTVVNLISSIFMQAWQFSAVASSSDEEVCKRFYTTVFKGFLSVIAIGSAVLILASRFLTGLLLNVSYFEAWRYMPTLLCAAAIESIVSFLATVYMVRKKSMHSFLTAMLGTVLNVLLNLLLIPRMGALGAAIATLCGYLIVLIARLIDAPRIIRFDLCLPRMFLSAVLLLLSSVLMTVVPDGYLLWTALVTLLILALNAIPLLRGVQNMLDFRRHK